MQLFDLSGKVALITGAAHGLGMAMAMGLGEAGARLVINGHTPAKMDKALATYREAGLEAQGCLFDVTDEAAVQSSLAQIEAQEVISFALLISKKKWWR
jgi:gluconate 5-dehydrogenase